MKKKRLIIARNWKKAPCLYCEALVWAYGLCRTHWSRWYNRIPMDGRKREPKAWIHHNGYRWIWRDGKDIPEHRYVMEQHLGRKLKPGEDVHHINKDILDNRIENLAVIDHAAHVSLHQKEEGVPVTCVICGTQTRVPRWQQARWRTCSKVCSSRNRSLALKRAWKRRQCGSTA